MQQPLPTTLIRPVQSDDGYYASFDMATALHPQTIVAVKFADEVLPAKYGRQFQIVFPTFSSPPIFQ